MKLEQIVERIVEETAVELTDAFDRNFETKSFFGQKWPSNKTANSRGSQLLRSGDLRRSIQQPRQQSKNIGWSSSLPYASIQNEGGEIKVTKKMKSFFWAMYYKSAGAVTKTASGKTSNSKRNQKLNKEAAKWKAMALKKTGSTITIEQRQFIGWHPQVDKIIGQTADYNIKRYNEYLKEKLKE